MMMLVLLGEETGFQSALRLLPTKEMTLAEKDQELWEAFAVWAVWTQTRSRKLH